VRKEIDCATGEGCCCKRGGCGDAWGKGEGRGREGEPRETYLVPSKIDFHSFGSKTAFRDPKRKAFGKARQLINQRVGERQLSAFALETSLCFKKVRKE